MCFSDSGIIHSSKIHIWSLLAHFNPINTLYISPKIISLFNRLGTPSESLIDFGIHCCVAIFFFSLKYKIATVLWLVVLIPGKHFIVCFIIIFSPQNTSVVHIQYIDITHEMINVLKNLFWSPCWPPREAIINYVILKLNKKYLKPPVILRVKLTDFNI